MNKETIIYKFTIGEIDILPVEHFPDFLSIVNSMAQARKRDMEQKEIHGFSFKYLAELSMKSEALIKADKFTQASLILREMYKYLDI